VSSLSGTGRRTRYPPHMDQRAQNNSESPKSYSPKSYNPTVIIHMLEYEMRSKNEQVKQKLSATV